LPARVNGVPVAVLRPLQSKTNPQDVN
jgi:hypothetical protein